MDRAAFLKVGVLFAIIFRGFMVCFTVSLSRLWPLIYVICWYILSKLVNMILHMSYIYNIWPYILSFRGCVIGVFVYNVI